VNEDKDQLTPLRKREGEILGGFVSQKTYPREKGFICGFRMEVLQGVLNNKELYPG